MHWLQKFAENYSGSGDIDRHNVADGSETPDEDVQDARTDGGVYMDNNYYPATMPMPLDVHNSIYDMADNDKPNPSRSDEYSDQPFGEQMVDANHANNVISASQNVLPKKTDMTMQYNTELEPHEEEQFQNWANQNKRQNDTFDYDMRGWWKNDGKQSQNGHFSDLYKKPNHPTFSNQSIYHGVDGHEGGTWNGSDEKSWTFTPGATNLKYHTLPQLHNYFKTTEPGNKIASYSGTEVAGEGANFLHDAPDSPNILHDGYPIEELENNQNGINSVVNTDAPHANDSSESMLARDPSITNKVHSLFDNIPDINKNRMAILNSNISNPFTRSAREISDMKDTWTDTSGSNVQDIMNPREVGIKHDRSTHDFGTKDESGDETNMSANPGKGYSGNEYESMLYSGIQPSAAEKTLNNYIAKKLCCTVCGSEKNDIRGRICDKCAFKKKAEGYVAVNPSENSNSGRDNEDDENDLSMLIQPPPSAMTDGKPIDNEFHEQNLLNDDPTIMRKKQKYNNTNRAGDDSINYYNVSGTGGGFGNEGDGQNFSGIQN